MSTHKHIDKICCVAVALALVITVLFMNGKSLGIVSAGKSLGYENRLFATDRVHTIDIVMNDWEGFIETCENEEYSMCSVVIDGENYSNIGIRAKGNTSLSNVSQMDSDRYSFKLEFDQYDNTKSYYGLDKISLNNIIQDNTYMKDYLVYRMMGEFGVAAPLCSYVYITVNGKDFGLYLAVESIEESFLKRNYGNDYGELYKPDSMSFGGGRGNGKDFDFSEFENNEENAEDNRNNQMPTPPEGFGGRGQRPFGDSENLFENGEMPYFSQMPDMSQIPEMPENFENRDFADRGNKGGMGGGKGSDDVKLKYIDDAFESYSNIFDNAKTDITDADKTRLIESLKKLSNGENIESVVDIEQVIKYFVVHNFVVNGDSYTGNMIHNYYLYEKDGVMSMLPWDYNLAFGTFQSSDATSTVNSAIDSPVSGGNISDRPMIAWIFENEEYTNLYHEYFSQFINEYFDSGKVEKIIDDTVGMISPYVEKDPTKFCDYDSFVLGASTLKKFCMLRAESVSRQLNGTISSTN
ncbi:MAG: CotH kinase family protein, partial [Clostridia bacterium]|nr:CotH kinase family protein [Clostridia bacterium]